MATDKIFIGIDDQVIELTGDDKKAFLAERAELQKQDQLKQAQLATQRELKISAYTKLGLTEEEINAIL